MFILSYALNIAGTEWFIIILFIIILLVPTKINNITKSIGKFVGEYEKTKSKILNEKNNFIQETNSIHKYIGPIVQRPISSDREKLELIAKSLDILTENKSEEEIKLLISKKLNNDQ